MKQEWSSYLEEGWSALHAALTPLKNRNPDDIQVQLYKYSFNYANLAIAEHLIEEQNARSDHDSIDFQLSSTVVSGWLANALEALSIAIQSDSEFSYAAATADFVRQTKNTSNLNEQLALLDQLDGEIPWAAINEEKDSVRTSIRRFADDVVAPQAEAIHRQDLMIPDSILDGVRDLGCFGFSVPDQYGGLKPNEGEDTTGMVVVTEELSRGSLGAAGSLITRPEIVVRALLEGGTEQQRSRWLPGLALGNPLCAVAVTEPNCGSDVASVATRATKIEGGWLLNGEKTWCTFAGKAGLLLVLARTDNEVSPPHRGLSLFIVEKPSTNDHEFQVEGKRGTLSGSAIPTLGYRGMHSYTLHFDDFFLPDDCLVGENEGLNRGFYYTMRGFSGGRLQTAARAIGLMQAAYEAAYDYTGIREIFGNSLRSFQLTHAKLLDMVTQIVAIRRYAYKVARLMDNNEGQLEASLVKLVACRAAESVTREALQLHGGLGYAEETAVSRYFVDARVLSIFEGAEETLALRVVGRALFDEIDARIAAE